MAVKDVVEYYNIVARQYNELIVDIKDFERECAEGLVEPERLEQIKENIQPLINNYNTLSYIMFLLNQPTKKDKIPRYKKQNNKLLKDIPNEFTEDGIISKNKEVLDTYRG
jgi:hypothetical protein